MTTYDWPTERDRAIQLFNGDTPGGELELAILGHFQEHPGRVHNLIDAIARRVATGNVRSGWAILRTELDTKPADITATDHAERAATLRRAETWIRNAGCYIAHQDELEDELFGERGPLRQWPDLKPQLVATWQQHHARALEAEHEANNRAARQAASYQRVRQTMRTSSLTTTELDEHAMRVHAEVERARLAYLASIAPDPNDLEPIEHTQ